MRRKLFIFLVILTSHTISAQDLTPPEGGFAALIVSHMDPSKSWYLEVLGFQEVNHIVNKERGIEIANLKHGAIGLELIQINGSISRDSLMAVHPRPISLQGIFKFGIYITKFDEWILHLRPLITDLDNQIVKDPNTNKRMVVIRDPDGNRIQLLER